MDLSGGPVRDPDGKILYLLSAFEDISELKLAEQRVQEEVTKLQTLMETLPDMVWLKDVNGVYRFCNPRFETFFGKRMEDIIGKTDYDFVDRELADFFRAHDRLAMEKGGFSVNEEWVTFASDGHRELLETIKTPMRDATGETVGVLGIARDVTRSRADQERLRKLSMAIEQNTVAVAITDREGRIEYINPRFTEITGYGAEDALGQNPHILKSGVTPPEVYQQLWTTILGGQVWRGELQNRRKNGETYWAALSISPILDESGSITHFVALQEDITGRMRMGEQLRESEEQYRSLFKNMLNGFALCRMLYDDQGRGEDFVYLAVNHSFETLTGLKDVQGRRVSEVIPGIRESNRDLLELYGRVARTGVPEILETYVKPLEMWFSISVYSPKPDHFVAVFDVITERKRAEAAVKAQLSELQRWHEATLGREGRILDLKREVNALRARLGEPPRYGSAGSGEAPEKQS
jgi:PAS domain S-box-containing protein